METIVMIMVVLVLYFGVTHIDHDFDTKYKRMNDQIEEMKDKSEPDHQ